MSETWVVVRYHPRPKSRKTRTGVFKGKDGFPGGDQWNCTSLPEAIALKSAIDAGEPVREPDDSMVEIFL